MYGRWKGGKWRGKWSGGDMIPLQPWELTERYVFRLLSAWLSSTVLIQSSFTPRPPTRVNIVNLQQSESLASMTSPYPRTRRARENPAWRKDDPFIRVSFKLQADIPSTHSKVIWLADVDSKCREFMPKRSFDFHLLLETARYPMRFEISMFHGSSREGG